MGFDEPRRRLQDCYHGCITDFLNPRCLITLGKRHEELLPERYLSLQAIVFGDKAGCAREQAVSATKGNQRVFCCVELALRLTAALLNEFAFRSSLGLPTAKVIIVDEVEESLCNPLRQCRARRRHCEVYDAGDPVQIDDHPIPQPSDSLLNRLVMVPLADPEVGNDVPGRTVRQRVRRENNRPQHVAGLE
jgi:hypothetical protein